MNANPPSTQRRCVTRTAATTFRRNPVTEMAFGVSRDSISRPRAYARNSWPVRTSRSWPPGTSDATAGTLQVTRRGGSRWGFVHPLVAPRPGVRPEPRELVSRDGGEAGDHRAERCVEPEVVSRDDDDEEDAQRIDGPQDPRPGAPDQVDGRDRDHRR